jgi:hypothetical protein
MFPYKHKRVLTSQSNMRFCYYGLVPKNQIEMYSFAADYLEQYNARPMKVTSSSVLTRKSINPQLIYFWINQGIIAYEDVNFCKHISAFEFYEFQSSLKSCFQFNILLSPPLNWVKAEHIWTTFKTSTCHNLAPTHKLLIYELLITASVTCVVPNTDHLGSVTVFVHVVSVIIYSIMIYLL